MSEFIDLEYHRITRQIGALLKAARLREGLSKAQVAEKLSLHNPDWLRNVERGHLRGIRLLPKLAQLYSKRINFYLDFPDDNRRLELRQKQGQDSWQDFCQRCGHDLQRMREDHNFTVEQLAEMSHIQVEEISRCETGEAPIDMDKVCLLATFFNRNILPELVSID